MKAGPRPIDRRALTARHNITWDEPSGQVPLGNGEFCFNADGTGLQTIGGNILSHWGWHNFPLPAGYRMEDIPFTGTFEQGRLTGEQVWPAEHQPLAKWMYQNPHRLNLGRLRLTWVKGRKNILASEIKNLSRTHDLWTGLHRSWFKLRGQIVEVQTCVHPEHDLVAVRVESPLLEMDELSVTLDFSCPQLECGAAWMGDFGQEKGHRTEIGRRQKNAVNLVRLVDETRYCVRLSWSDGGNLEEVDRGFSLRSGGAAWLDVQCAFGRKILPKVLPGFMATVQACAEHWQGFWTSGGVIDLAGSTDPRAPELERRIVLSQYLLAAQSAGSLPPSEAGLMDIDPWSGQFHMEMVWWHMAHYALWSRLELADRAVHGFYERARPRAEALARQLGYKGMMWPKMTGPEGRNSVWKGNNVLLWKQPHPIHFAELEYRLQPTRSTLEKWKDLVFGTATFMASYPRRDVSTGHYSLSPVMPVSEQGTTENTVFELAYWRFGLRTAQVWRERLGLTRVPKWDTVGARLAPLPVRKDVYLRAAAWPDTYTRLNWEHPDPACVVGMLPPGEGVDVEVARRTLWKVHDTWKWSSVWGWDFPWVAMAAARLGEPQLAVDMLLKKAGTKNRYDARGVCIGGPCPYLPGNGGLLYAVAMMAAGWDGAPARHAPGFPDNGLWNVRWEGLKPAL